MILVLLGTQNNDFSRLLNKIEKCIDNGIIKDEIIVQAGHTKYNSSKMKIFDFISSKEIIELINKADLIITHGGVGSILSTIKLGKKVIAVARLKKYGEHVNDHQIQIVEAFDSNGYLKGVVNIDNFENVVKDISEFTPTPYISNTENILKIVSNYIDNN